MSHRPLKGLALCNIWHMAYPFKIASFLHGHAMSVGFSIGELPLSIGALCLIFS